MAGYSYWSYEEPAWDSEYDSTWDDDEDYKIIKESRPKKYRMCSWNRAAEDLQHYRRGYPHSWKRAAEDLQHYGRGYPEDMPNLIFYRNEFPFQPGGVCIDYLYKMWKHDYYKLELNHGYIQWLFPLREPGMNSYATPLTKEEIEEMKKDKEVMKRFLESYKLMLGFYGIKLVDVKTGMVALADNWKERFANLNNHSHNNLRITRILKCLGELGYEHFQAPLVRLFLEETLRHGKLPNVKRSVLDYFVFTVKNKSERKDLVLYAWEHYQPKKLFIWGPVERLQTYRPPAQNQTQIMPTFKKTEEKNMSAQKKGRKQNSEFGIDKNVELSPSQSPVTFGYGGDENFHGPAAESGLGEEHNNDGHLIQLGDKNERIKDFSSVDNGEATVKVCSEGEKVNMRSEIPAESKKVKSCSSTECRLREDVENVGQKIEKKRSGDDKNGGAPVPISYEANGGPQLREGKNSEELSQQLVLGDIQKDGGPPIRSYI